MKTILSLAVVTTFAWHLQAGTPSAKAPVPALNSTASNPLPFADGRVVFGVEDMSRFEYRDNNFDFNSSTRTINDDEWFLNRARISLQLKPIADADLSIGVELLWHPGLEADPLQAFLRQQICRQAAQLQASLDRAAAACRSGRSSG